MSALRTTASSGTTTRARSGGSDALASIVRAGSTIVPSVTETRTKRGRRRLVLSRRDLAGTVIGEPFEVAPTAGRRDRQRMERRRPRRRVGHAHGPHVASLAATHPLRGLTASLLGSSITKAMAARTTVEDLRVTPR